MLHLCSGEQAAIPRQAVQAGAHALLNTMGAEDVMGEAPKAADWVSSALPAIHSFCMHTTCALLVSGCAEPVQRSCRQSILFSLLYHAAGMHASSALSASIHLCISTHVYIYR